MDDIFKKIALLEHDLLTVRIFDISGEYFVYVELNVNLWTPCSLYYYNQDSRELIQLFEFSNKETNLFEELDDEMVNAFWEAYSFCLYSSCITAILINS